MPDGIDVNGAECGFVVICFRRGRIFVTTATTERAYSTEG